MTTPISHQVLLDKRMSHLFDSALRMQEKKKIEVEWSREQTKAPPR